MLKRPLIFLALVMALLLGFMLGLIVAESDLNIAALRDLLARLPIAEHTENARPGGTRTPPAETERPAPDAPARTPAPDESEPDLVPVVRTIDGDTIVVRLDGREENVRLLQINTPERGQPGYKESTAALRKLVAGQQVRLEYEKPGKPERDRYDRLLAYVFLDGKHVNVEMVRLGWTPYWTRYGKGRYPTQFERAQSEAIGKHRGLWATPAKR